MASSLSQSVMMASASGLASPNVPTPMLAWSTAPPRARATAKQEGALAIVLLQRDVPACGAWHAEPRREAAPRYASAFCRAERCGRPGAWPGERPLQMKSGLPPRPGAASPVRAPRPGHSRERCAVRLQG